jgi:GTPase
MKFCAESESDNFEYKEHIIFIENKRFDHYITQINYRLLIGNGVCRYLIGVGDDGTVGGLNTMQIARSVKNLLIIAKNVSEDVDNSVYPTKIYFVQANSKNIPKEIDEKSETSDSVDGDGDDSGIKYFAFVELKSDEKKYTEADIITFSESDSDTEYN